MWLVGVFLLVTTALASAEDSQQDQQQRQQLEAVDQPPAHVVYGLLVEPWLNVSSRHRRRPEPQRDGRSWSRLTSDVRKQALVTATLLNAALGRSAPFADLQRALGDFKQASPGHQLNLLSSSLTQLSERLRGPVIRLEAMLIAQQTDLLNVTEALKALQERDDASGAITKFVNSVTATMGRRVSTAEADISRLGDSLRQLNGSVVSGLHRQQVSSEAEDEQRRDGDGAGTEADQATEADSEETETDQTPDSSRSCCDRLEARLARLEAAAGDRDRLADRLEVALARLQALEEQQALLLRNVGHQTAELTDTVDTGPNRQLVDQKDLTAAESVRRGALLTEPDTIQPLTGADTETQRHRNPPGGEVTGRSSRVREPDIITTDSLVSGDSRQATVILGRSIHVTGSEFPRTRGGLPPQTPVVTGSSLHTLLQAGTPDRPERGGWRPMPAADRQSRLLPVSAATAAVAVSADSDTGAVDPSYTDTEEADEGAEPTDTAATAGGDQQAESSDLSPAVARLPAQPPSGDGAEVRESPPPPDAVGRAGVAPRRGRPRVPPQRPPAPVQPGPQSRPVLRGSRRLRSCQPAPRYAGLVGMTQWCLFNCPIYCPPSHCRCQWVEY